MSDLKLSPQEKRIVEYHNNSMKTGRVGRDSQGRPMTVYSTGILIDRGPNKGKFVSVPAWVPSVNPDRPLTEGEAFDHWESQINEGKWPFYESGPALNARSQEIHTIMDRDAKGINFNPAGTWDQSPEDEAAGIERATQGGGQTLEMPAYQGNAPETSLRPRLRPEDPEMSSTTGMMGTDAQGNLMEYGIEPDVMMANMQADGTQSVLINDPELEMLRSMMPPAPDPKPSLDYVAPEDETLGSFRNMDIKTLYPAIYRDTSGNDVGSAGPMATSGLHYIDTRGNGDKSMSGDGTPTHLQRLQDTQESFVSSQMFLAAMDQMRAQLPKEAVLRGSMFGEQGDDGLFHLFVGDDDTGYTEMTYGGGEDGISGARLDARKALNYASQMADYDMDGGFMGRVAMAHTYRGYEDSDLERMQADLAREARETVARDGSMGNPNVGANLAAILEQSEKIEDEQKRRGAKKETRGFDYSARVLSREISEKAKSAWGGFVETAVPAIDGFVSGATSVGMGLDNYFGTEDMTAFPKINPSEKARGSM